jgi:hypothetical protein
MSFVDFCHRIGVSIAIERSFSLMLIKLLPFYYLFLLSFDIQIMGKGRKWTAHERECAALAWLTTMNNFAHQADWSKPSGKAFQSQLHSILKTIAPVGAQFDRYAGRKDKSIYVFLRDQILPDVRKFVHKSLPLVLNSNPVNVTEDQVISMTIAIHLKKTDRMDYTFKNYDHNHWQNYRAWKVLRQDPSFRPASVPELPDQNSGAEATAETAILATPSPTSLQNIMNGDIPEATPSHHAPMDVDQDLSSLSDDDDDHDDDDSASMEEDSYHQEQMWDEKKRLHDKKMAILDNILRLQKQLTEQSRHMARVMKLRLVWEMARKNPEKARLAQTVEQELFAFYESEYGCDLRANKKS